MLSNVFIKELVTPQTDHFVVMKKWNIYRVIIDIQDSERKEGKNLGLKLDVMFSLIYKKY